MSSHTHTATILHQDSHGYLAYCANCYGFQLSFGTFYVNHSFADLQAFAELINRYHFRYQFSSRRHGRFIYLPSPYEGFGLVLSPVDLEHLNTMLQKSLLILAANNPVTRQ